MAALDIPWAAPVLDDSVPATDETFTMVAPSSSKISEKERQTKEEELTFVFIMV
jgi:hypothetical protein